MPKADRKSKRAHFASASSLKCKESIDSSSPPTLQNAVSKKDKKMMRRQLFLQKLQPNKQVKEKPKKLPPVDLSCLETALIEVQQVQEEGAEKKEKEKAKRAAAPVSKSRKKREKTNIQESLRFDQVLRHPSFKTSPLDCIRQHLENTWGKG